MGLEDVEKLVEELRAEAKNEEHVALVERTTGRQAWGFQRTAEALRRYAFKLEAALRAAPSLHKEGTGDELYRFYSCPFHDAAFDANCGNCKRVAHALEELLAVAEWAVYALEHGSSVEVYWLRTVAKDKHAWARRVIASASPAGRAATKGTTDV